MHPIQEQAIPLSSKGKDLIAVRQTGTGQNGCFFFASAQQTIKGGEHRQDVILRGYVAYQRTGSANTDPTKWRVLFLFYARI